MSYADLILVNGNIHTMDADQPTAEAVAVGHGRIIAVGTNRQILSLEKKNTKKIDLKGKTVIPGFIDTHVHGASLGRTMSQISLRDVKSIKEIQRRIKELAKKVPEGRWITSRGWDQERLAENRCPNRSDLDKASCDHPILLLRVCGHLGVANSKALELAGISKKTEPPEGGLIDKDKTTGKPNGVLREKALNLIYDILPEPCDEDLAKTLLLACQRMVEEGITTVHWILSSANEMRILQHLALRKKLPLRIYILVPVKYIDDLIRLGLSTGFGNNRIKIGSVKILADGSLGARTAALKRPYEDAPESEGMMLYSQTELEKFIEKAHTSQLQLAIHVIGDKAAEIVLTILERVLRKTPSKNHRHRLEHVSVLSPWLMKKIEECKVIASVQPHFIISDFWIPSRLGKTRARWTYAFKSLVRKGVVVMGGSDAPIEPVSPMSGIYAATARETFSQEQLTIHEALSLYTINAAYGSFEEELKGSIKKHKLADLTVLSDDPYKMELQQLRKVKVEMTIVGGETVYVKRS